MSEVHVRGQLVCATEAEAATVVRLLPEHIARTRAEGGCLSFEVTPSSDPLVWNVEERFGSEGAFRSHQERIAASEWGRGTAGIERRYAVQGEGR